MRLHEWLEASQREVAVRYPQFRIVQPPAGSGSVQAWEGVIQPFPDNAELGAVLRHLEGEADLIVRGGQVLHDPSCSQGHAEPDYLASLTDTGRSFKIVVLAYPPKADPRAFAIDPKISRRVFPGHPHLYGNALCPYTPSDGIWMWDSHNVADFLDYISIWLGRHLVWEQTGACNGGKWIGPWAPHEPQELLDYVGREDLCPCGSGRKYKRCCRGKHLSIVRKQNRRSLVRGG